MLGRLSTRRALIIGGCVAGAGILLGVALPALGRGRASASPSVPAGASLFWPLVMSTVSRLASQVVSAVGTFTAAGYIGWVAGAPIVGLGLADLRARPRPAGPGRWPPSASPLCTLLHPSAGRRDGGQPGSLGRSP